VDPILLYMNQQKKKAPSAPSSPAAPPMGTQGWVTPPAPKLGEDTRRSIFGDMIKNDEIYKQLAGDLSGEGISDAAGRAAAVRRALAQYGAVPNMARLKELNPNWAGFLDADIDEATKQLAAKNTADGTSIQARLQRQHDDAFSALKAQLAAQGVLDSGEFTVGTERLGREFTNSQSDALNQLMDIIGGVYGSFADNERKRQRELAAGVEAASGRIGDIGDPAVDGDLVTFDANGNPVAVFKVGNVYLDANGNVVPDHLLHRRGLTGAGAASGRPSENVRSGFRGE
jgi:hypothetical protein